MSHLDEVNMAIKSISQHISKETNKTEKSGVYAFKHKLSDNKKVSKFVSG